jgi:hypothetical protein
MDPHQIQAAVGGIAGIVIYLIAFGGLAIGNGFIAARMGKSVALWVILSLIPLYNFFFIYYVWFYVICRVLNRLNQIADRVGAISGPLRG